MSYENYTEDIERIKQFHRVVSGQYDIRNPYLRVLLVDCFNHCTCPWLPRTDKEHRILGKLARKARKLLANDGMVFETESGRMAIYS